MIQRLKTWLFERKMLDIQEFAHRHRSYLVIVCDPKDDTMFVSYRGRQIAGRIKSADGKNHKVVKNMLKHSTFDREIDRFIGAIVDTMKVPLERADGFLKFVDGALFNISKAVRKDKK